MILERALWRVGFHLDPVGFTPRELSAFSHRFDDVRGRFRTLYCAELAEPVELTDPVPEALAKVAATWRLRLEPVSATARPKT